MTKPFKLGELCSRIRALLRRANVSGPGWQETIECGALRIDLLGSRVSLNGSPLDLTGAEYRLLCLFLKNSGRVLTRGTILDKLWDGAGNFVDDNTLTVNINRLRKKLESEGLREFIGTKKGVGYYLEGEGMEEKIRRDE